MSVGLYMDVHVPAAITNALRRRGVDVLTAQADATAEWDDPQLLDRAGELGRILFTQDEDLLAEGAHRHRTNQQFVTIVFARQTFVSIGRCVEDLELVSKLLTPEECHNQVIHLPL